VTSRAEIKKGTLREDLYYRLNVIAIELPALRDRRADIVPLATFFLGRYAEENGRNIDGITEARSRSFRATSGRATCASSRT